MFASNTFRKLFTGTLIAGALAFTAVLTGTPAAPIADAAAATSISGTVTEASGGTRVSGARVYLQRAPAGGTYQDVGWVSTNASGNYSIGGLSNWYWYRLYGYKVFGSCGISITPIYAGWSQEFWATGGARGANIRIAFTGRYAC